MIAIIRLRGRVKVKKVINNTMEMLKLKSVNNCVVIPETETYIGMVNKIKDYVTYGTISKEIFEKMLLKWGRIEGNKRITDAYLKEKKYTVDKLFQDLGKSKVKLRDIGIKIPFRLHPPRKGLKSIKKPFSMKGDLGNRNEKINDLLERMI
jgi:large subunit ribosomal protein L30